MIPFGWTATTLGVSVSTLAVIRSLKKKTLSKSGAVAAWCVGFLMVGSGLRGFVLLMFYQIASSATKYKKDWKQKHDATAAEGSVRGPTQVLGCSIVAVVLSLYHVAMVGSERDIRFDEPLAASLTCAILAHHATCLADTLASELGILAKSSPVLITEPWRSVPPGTNGGVTLWGTFMSIVGGALMGLGTAWMDWCSGISPVQTLNLVLLGALSGCCGSLIDSLLGATLQTTYFDNHAVHHDWQVSRKLISGRNILTNVQVNLVSVALTSWLGGWVFGPWIFSKST